MTPPAPSGPVTMATVCQVVWFCGNDERSVTFRSASTPGALTRAPPLTRIWPAGHEVFATRTDPTAGLGADLTGAPERTETAARVPAGPVAPTSPLAPCGPWAPVAPRGPWGPDVLAGMAATAYAPTPSPLAPSASAQMTTGMTHFGQTLGVGSAEPSRSLDVREEGVVTLCRLVHDARRSARGAQTCQKGPGRGDGHRRAVHAISVAYAGVPK